MKNQEIVELILEDAGVLSIATEQEKQLIDNAITQFNDAETAYRDYNGDAVSLLNELSGADTVASRQEATNEEIRRIVDTIHKRHS